MRTPQTTRETVSLKGKLRSIPDHKFGFMLLIGLALAAGALFAFARLADEMLEGETQRFDDWARSAIHQFASPVLTSFMRGVTMLGSPLVLAPLTILAMAGFWVTKQRRAAFLLAITMIGAAVLHAVLKASFHRTRPIPFFDTPPPASFSFPSGHALDSFCFYITIAVLISARSHSRAVRTLVWAIAAMLVTLIGISRIYLGVHYPSDVLAGYAAAFVWVMMVSFGDHALPHKHDSPKPGDG